MSVLGEQWALLYKFKSSTFWLKHDTLIWLCQTVSVCPTFDVSNHCQEVIVSWCFDDFEVCLQTAIVAVFRSMWMYHGALPMNRRNLFRNIWIISLLFYLFSWYVTVAEPCQPIPAQVFVNKALVVYWQQKVSASELQSKFLILILICTLHRGYYLGSLLDT